MSRHWFRSLIPVLAVAGLQGCAGGCNTTANPEKIVHAPAHSEPAEVELPNEVLGGQSGGTSKMKLSDNTNVQARRDEWYENGQQKSRTEFNKDASGVIGTRVDGTNLITRANTTNTVELMNAGFSIFERGLGLGLGALSQLRPPASPAAPSSATPDTPGWAAKLEQGVSTLVGVAQQLQAAQNAARLNTPLPLAPPSPAAPSHLTPPVASDPIGVQVIPLETTPPATDPPARSSRVKDDAELGTQAVTLKPARRFGAPQ